MFQRSKSGSDNGKPRRVWGFSLVAMATVFLSACGGTKSDFVTLTGEAQGTTFTIKYRDAQRRDLSREVDSVLKVIDRSLSLWVEGSTVNVFNAAVDTFSSADAHFRVVYAMSLDLWRGTGGAFDPTVLPLVRAWGLGREGRAALDTTAVDSIMAFVGMDRFAAWHEQVQDGLVMRFRKFDPRVHFDPNGIAQGYTVDVVTHLLEQAGITDLMVEIGGEVRAKGRNESGQPWAIQIDKPVEGEAHVRQTVVPLADRALATSGNYRKYIEAGGRRYGHTIDPRTGRPSMNALLSATVIAADCATADALATALLVMGPDEAKAWLTAHREVEAYLITDDGAGGYAVWHMPGWPSP